MSIFKYDSKYFSIMRGNIMPKSLQDQYAPKSICFGCGPANRHGLKIKSVVEGNSIVARFTPKPYHNAFENILCGGIIGVLLDCHCNWTAAYYLMGNKGLDQPPCTVTAEYSIKLLRPAPMNQELKLVARLERIANNRAYINGELFAGDKLCDTCHGIFVAVSEGHPAYHRW